MTENCCSDPQFKALQSALFIQRLLEARSVGRGEGKLNGSNAPFLKPQDVEIALYLLSNRMKSGKNYTQRVWRSKLDSLSYSYAKFSEYAPPTPNSENPINGPSKNVLSSALRRLEQLDLIKYEIDKQKIRCPESGELIRGSKGPTVKLKVISKKTKRVLKTF
ncbi:hypothetical protein D5018_20870 [Parashewanella curva]|uniref:Uncharacterized protein n=1 Tax=Parashewanella curva TaxID=2338552 RepID=A0A3L8PQT5_9GAMM|nr:hypothetical protein [Parashewanella curva]RLV57751.1 hypothetical protein D5018_20870 [Parashewanella curva]